MLRDISLVPETWTSQALRGLGADIEKLAEAEPAAVRAFTERPQTVSLQEINRIFLAVEQQTGDPHVGLRVSQQADLSKLGLYGYLLQNAETLRELLEICETYYSTLMRNAEVSVTIGPKTTSLNYTPLMHSKVSPRHDNECTLGFFVQIIRDRLGPDWMPAQVSFANSAPASREPLVEMFGEILLFDQPANQVVIESSWLPVSVCDSEADRGLLAIARENADTLLDSYAKEANFEASLRLLILKNLETKNRSAAHVAREMGMSLATFKRRLTDCGRTYRGVKEELTVSLAKRALADTQSRISNIALMLGYSELSAFDRAFLRLSGMTPSDYRRKAQQERTRVHAAP